MLARSAPPGGRLESSGEVAARLPTAGFGGLLASKAEPRRKDSLRRVGPKQSLRWPSVGVQGGNEAVVVEIIGLGVESPRYPRSSLIEAEPTVRVAREPQCRTR